MQFVQHLIEFIANHYLLSGAFLVVLVLLIVTEGRKAGKALTSQQATVLLNRENAVLVDIRPKKDFAAGHIVDSINIPLDSFATRVVELDKHREKPIILACANGQHAGAASKQLKAAGYANVNRLAHGISGWRADNLPLVK